MPKPCPPEVIEAGRALVNARRVSESLSDLIDLAIMKLGPAVDVMVKEGGAKRMEAGSAYAKLRQAQMAFGLICDAHNDLRQVLGTYDYSEPTNEQIASIR